MVRGAVYSMISAIAYGAMAVLVKLCYQAGMNEWQMLHSRFLFGTLIIGGFILVKNPGLFRIRLRTLLAVAVIGMAVFTTQTLCFYRAIKYIPASTTVLIFYGYPAAVTILSAIFLRMRFTATMLLSLASVTVGCALVFYDAFLRGADSTGLMYAVAAMLIFSAYLILAQLVIKGEKPLTVTFYMVLFTGLGYCFHESPGVLLTMNLEQLGLGLALAVLPTALAVSFLFLAIEEIGSAWASIFSSFEPVATLILAGLLLQEPVVVYQLLGVALILFGIVMPNLRTMRKVEKLQQQKRRLSP